MGAYQSTVSTSYSGVPYNGNLAITEGSCGFQRIYIQITDNLAITDSVNFSGNIGVFRSIKGRDNYEMPAFRAKFVSWLDY